MNYEAFDKYGIPRPPVFSGMAGSGDQMMFSLGGKWYKSGQKTPSGYLIDSYDPNSYTLGVSYEGVPVPVKMQGSVVQPYVPEFIKMSSGSETEQDVKRLKAMGIPYGNTFMQDPSADLGSYIDLDEEQIGLMADNFKNSEMYNKFKDYKVMNLGDFEKARDAGEQVRALVPKQFVDPETGDTLIDFDAFTSEPPQ